MNTTQIIPVQAPGADYPIYVGAGWLDKLPDLLRERGITGKLALVTNDVLAPLYGDRLRALLPAAAVITIPDGEAHKSLDTVRTIYDALFAAELDRKSAVIAFGGGVLGDTVGFAAATFLRGVALVQIPTTLLSMVDSSVGGKVGVDVPQGKNLVGAFKQPQLVIVDTNVLKTLSDHEWRCGSAEVIKAGLLRDPHLLQPAIYDRRDSAATVEMITRAIKIKVNIVEADPYEAGDRALLNLGHTFGHAIERVSEFSWKHGDAVSVGLVAAARLSRLQGLCDADVPARIEALLTRLAMPVRYQGLNPAAIRAAMNTDKKRINKALHFVLLRGVGDPLLTSDVDEANIISVLDSLREA